MKRVMIDIETMGTKPNAVIQSVAIQQFNMKSGDIGPYIHIFLPVREQLTEGRVMDYSTLVWWQEQDINAQIAVLQGRYQAEKVGYTLECARRDIALMLQDVEEIWANDPDFDCVILRDFMGDDYKWPFWTHRSCRTLRSLVPHTDRTKPEIAHDAHSDCIAQITDVQNQYMHLIGPHPEDNLIDELGAK